VKVLLEGYTVLAPVVLVSFSGILRAVLRQEFVGLGSDKLLLVRETPTRIVGYP
jgi:hypothetical protein